MSATSQSHVHPHSHNQDRGDPTHTQQIQNRYEREFENWFFALLEEIRPRVFNQNEPEPPPNIFQFENDPRRIDLFMQWLEEQERQGLLRIIDRGSNTYVQSAYEQGLRNALDSLDAQGVQVEELQNVFALPVHRDTLQDLFTRNYELLQSVTEDMNEAVRETLTQGFAEGLNPNTIASQIANDIEEIGLFRSRILARSEVINAHSDATLNRYERIGVDRVGIRSEILTAGDSRVCPLCAVLEGEVVSVDEVRNGTFDVGIDDHPDVTPSLVGTYARKPPIHPQCRCTILPVVS